MDRFGAVWDNHRARIIANWEKRISHRDLVLVPGDISFAQDPNEDLATLHQLPGQIVFVPGNHDRWAQGITQTKLSRILDSFPSIHMLTFDKPFYETGEHLIVGYKGSEPQETGRWVAKHFNKTLEHARNAADKASYAQMSGHTVIVTTHYAPSAHERDVLAPLQPALWLHGHAHVGGDDRHLIEKWERERVNPTQKCISADYLGMVPIEVTGGLVFPPI